MNVLTNLQEVALDRAKLLFEIVITTKFLAP